MFDFKFLSSEDVVNILLSFDGELKESWNIYQKILFAINDRNFNKFKKIINDYCYEVKNPYIKSL